MAPNGWFWPLVATALALGGCAGMERDPAPVGERLSAPQARSALAGNTFIGDAADGSAMTLSFRRDGRLEGEPAGADEELGTWRMQDDYACLYQGDGDEECFGVYQVADDQYELIREDGRPGWRLRLGD